jgi:hypothetical protein
MRDLMVIEGDLQRIDVKRLVQYTHLIKDIGSLNHMMAPAYLRDFIMAYDLTNMMLAEAIRYDIETKTAFDAARSIAYLDRAGDYLSKRNIKDSAESRKQYVDVDPDVQKAADLRAKTEALVAFLKNRLQSFRLAHDDVKKMAYTDQYQTPNEGF